ncbi:MAG: tRNA (N6-threonylcarbamoyladenosine(37)-N6)-methyltransferase TrmO, partial [Paludibacteraceae bacterium]|nr:tRNA (N6-threonylcarbamoyladenosine(37)-N6)-methyltransferase TrmO [Paludibacteraceae bacterium]
LMDGTPIYDIKPYLPYTDAHPDAREGFTTGLEHQPLTVVTDCQTEVLTEEQLITLQKVIGQDPRPRYQSDETRVYGFLFAGHEVRFRVEGNTAHILTIEPSDSPA